MSDAGQHIISGHDKKSGGNINLLAIDTTLGACSAAIYKSGEIFSLHTEMERGHAERLMPMIEELRTQADIAMSDLDRIAVTSGPGTLTGVHIGIAAARGLALGVGCKIFHATSLRLIALKAIKELKSHDQQSTQLDQNFITIAMDARRGEVYLQCFDNQANPITKAAARTPGDAIAEIDEQAKRLNMASIIIGSASDILSAEGLSGRQVVANNLKDIQPNAKELVELALSADADDDEKDLSDHVSPLYLRAPDAKPQIGKSLLRAG